MTEKRFCSLLNRIREVRICIVGDVCLDLYWYADMRQSRLSRETPHFPLPVVRETYFPGAAGNVACNALALCPAKVTLVSAISEDWRGALLRDWMRTHGMDDSFLIRRKEGVTNCYCKPIRMGLSDVCYEDPRLDFENTHPCSEEEEQLLLQALDKAAEDADIIAVCDQFSHGVLTPSVIRRLEELAEDIPVVVDSRERIAQFRHFIAKPNEVEAAAAVGLSPAQNASWEQLRQIGLQLQRRNKRPCIITLGEQGALWCENDRAVLVKTAKAEPPVDIVGAGDTFLASFCCAYGAGASGEEALTIANLAAGVTVKKIGCTGTASPEEILLKWRESIP